MKKAKKNPSEILIMGLNPRKGKKAKNPHFLTIEQVEAKQQKAIDFMDRMDIEDQNDIAGMSPEEYAAHKGIEISANPGRKLKPVSEITDRAKRYRAQKNISGRKVCAKCGTKKNLMVGHKNGDESDGRPSNLMYICRSCNGKQAHDDKKHGRGVRTRQYNPGAKTLGAYVDAATKHTRGRKDAGGAVI